jgi:hypothetical protein
MCVDDIQHIWVWNRKQMFGKVVYGVDCQQEFVLPQYWTEFDLRASSQ